MKMLHALVFALISSTSFAQPVAVTPLTVSTVTGGGALGRMSTEYDGNSQPLAANRLYADAATSWPLSAFPEIWTDAAQVRTLAADAATTGDATQYSFTLSHHARVCVWHAAGQVSKPTWLTTTYDDTGEIAYFDDTLTPASAWCAILAPGAHNLGGNCPTGGCSGTRPMYVVSMLPVWRGGFLTSSTGSAQFAAADYTANESTTLTFGVERVGGSADTCSVTISEGTNPGNGVLNTTSLSWVAGEAGVKTGTVTLAAVSGNQIMGLTLSVPVGCALGAPTSLTINITDLSAPAPALAYYIDCNSGNDNADGLTPATAWLNPSRFNNVPASASGHVVARLRDGPCINGLMAPTAGGTDNSHQKKLCTDTSANVEIRGPPSGTAQEFVTSTSPNVGYITIGEGCPETGRIVMNAQCTAVNGGASTGCRVARFGTVNGTGWRVDVDFQNTAGWNGWYTASGHLQRLAMSWSVHGTPSDADGEDLGDAIWIDQGVAASTRTLIGGSTSWVTHGPTGHAATAILGGGGVQYGTICDNRWTAITGFTSPRVYQSSSAPWGGRCGAISRNATGFVLHDNIINGVGRSGPGDNQPWTEFLKCEGTGNAIVGNVFRNAVGWGLLATSASFSVHARGCVVAHNVFDRMGGPIFYLSDYTSLGLPGSSVIAGFEFYNNLFILPNQDGGCCNFEGSWDADNMVIGIDGVPVAFTSVTTRFDHNVIVNSSGNCADIRLVTYGGTPAVGTLTLPQLEASYPAIWNNNTCITPAQLATAMPSRPTSASTNLTSSDYLTSYTPAGGDTVFIGTGGLVTTAVGSGSNTTSLVVANGNAFPDPAAFGAPTVGQWAGAYQLHIGGVGNVTFTAVSKGTWPSTQATITLATPASWANGAAIGFSQSVGGTTSTPNRGIKRRRRGDRTRWIRRRRDREPRRIAA